MVGDPSSRKFNYGNNIYLVLLPTQDPTGRWGCEISLVDRMHQRIPRMLRQLVFGSVDFHIKTNGDPIL